MISFLFQRHCNTGAYEVCLQGAAGGLESL